MATSSTDGPSSVSSSQLPKQSASGPVASWTNQVVNNPKDVKCRDKRKELYAKYKKAKKQEKKRRREDTKKAEEDIPENERPVKVQKTIENQRILDETIVEEDDEEVQLDAASDELSAYFNGKQPKIMVTTSRKAIGAGTTYKFAEELINLMPDAEFIQRRNYDIKEITKYAINNDYTDIIVINEDKKVTNGMIITHLPDGPTARFKLSSVKLNGTIKNHAKQTNHRPELIMTNFDTRLGYTLGRMFNALFPQNPQYLGRQAVTFHNQRDFIFFRQHRYIFRDGKRVGLQEIGPRFTLKLKSVQKGTFDSKFGEFDFMLNRKTMEDNRRKFLL